MERLVTLTVSQRDQILRSLNEKQIEALGEFTRFAMLSKFHTGHYLENTDWEFVGMVVDPWYERSHGHRGENLYCDCGRRLKNQFILRSRSTGKRLKLGITHFQQHASIPMTVAKEIQRGVNEVHLYMDSILLKYSSGQRFPRKAFEYACQQGGVKNRESTILFQRCQLFNQVNLPLYQDDEKELFALVEQLKSGKKPRLTKKQIEQLLGAIADDWRQIEQQITLFNFYLSENGLKQQELHRIKSNATNYSLQRRKSRFLVQNWKGLKNLTLTKARAQLAIKLKELAFYLQITEPLASQLRISRTQAQQTLTSHQYEMTTSRSFGVREAEQLVTAIANLQ